MRVELFLNRDAPGYVDFLEDLKEELSGLEGLKYIEEKVPAPPKTLSEHEVVKFVFEHGGQLICLVTALIQLVRAASDRRTEQETPKKEPKDTPLAILSVGERQLKYPSSAQAERRFLEQVKKGKLGKKKSKHKRPSKKAKGKNK